MKSISVLSQTYFDSKPSILVMGEHVNISNRKNALFDLAEIVQFYRAVPFNKLEVMLDGIFT
jgi:hypothetical protein